MKKKETLNIKEVILNLKKTFKYIKPYKKAIILDVLITILLTLLGVLGPLLSAKLMLSLTNGELNILLLLEKFLLASTIMLSMERYVPNVVVLKKLNIAVL